MRVAAIHFGKTSDWDVNENQLIKLNIQAANEHGARLIVNSEMSILPLWSETAPIQVNSKADDVAKSREFAKWFANDRCPQFIRRMVEEVADPCRCYVVVSVITEDPQYHRLFTSALILGPGSERAHDGVYHTYHTGVLYGDIYAVKGASHLRPADLEIGKVGVMICADYSVPLIARSLVINGSELIAIPAALSSSTLDTLKVRAMENNVPLVMANCFEHDESVCYAESAIVSAGEEHATSKSESEILVCEIDSADPAVIGRREKYLGRRRPDLYEGVLVDLTSGVLRFNCPKPDKPEVSIVTISGKPDFNAALERIGDAGIVVLPEFPLEKLTIQEHLDHLKRREVYVACGFIEESHVVICLFDPQGKELMRYRKVHLSDRDVSNGIQSGDRLEFYLDLPMGRVAVLSGEDLLYPEAVESLRNCAVDLILAPANLDFDGDLLFKDIARSRHLSLAVADYESRGGVYKRRPNDQIAGDGDILKFNTQEGKIEPAKGLPAVPLVGAEILVQK